MQVRISPPPALANMKSLKDITLARTLIIYDQPDGRIGAGAHELQKVLMTKEGAGIASAEDKLVVSRFRQHYLIAGDNQLRSVAGPWLDTNGGARAVSRPALAIDVDR